MSDVVYLGLVVEGGENMTAVQVIEGQVSLPRVDKVHKLPPSKDVEGLRICVNVVNPRSGLWQTTLGRVASQRTHGLLSNRRQRVALYACGGHWGTRH